MTSADDPGINAADDEKGKTRRRIVGLYNWYGRANWLAWLFKSNGELAAVVASLGLIGGVAGTAVKDAATTYQKAKRSGPAVETVRWSPTSVVFPIEGRDEAGRRAAFEVLVLTKEFGWVKASTDQLSRAGRALSGEDIASEVFSAEVKTGLSRSRQVIAVGTASQEGELAEETHRAGLRARRSAEWAAAALAKETPIWTLNLGQYREPCAECETADNSWQRPFVLIGVRELADGTDLGQALASAMSGRANLPSPASYSTFGLTRFR